MTSVGKGAEMFAISTKVEKECRCVMNTMDWRVWAGTKINLQMADLKTAILDLH